MELGKKPKEDFEATICGLPEGDEFESFHHATG